MDYYDLLGVKRSASADELKTAYKRQAMKNHPDKGGDPEKFKQINEAYQALSDPQQKQMYDQFGTTDPQQARAKRGNVNFDFEDIFSHFGFGPNFGGGFANARRHPKNQDIKINYTIDFVEIYTGHTHTISYQLPSGKTEVLDMKIPPGIKDGDQVRFQGYGDDSIRNIARGDLIVLLRVKNNTSFQREGSNLYTKIKINVFDLILGIKIDINTPDNKSINLNIPSGTAPNTKFNITGYGVPDMHTQRRGNIIVEVLCEIPKLTENQQKSLQAIYRSLKTA